MQIGIAIRRLLLAHLGGRPAEMQLLGHLEIVHLLGHNTGGRSGERLMQRLGMSISDDTILRQVKRNAARADDDAPPRIVGIDDWSWRKSWRYGTIIVDLERRKVVDISAAPRSREKIRIMRYRLGSILPTKHDNAPVRDPQTGHLISPVIAATLCIKPRGTLPLNQPRKVDALKQGSPTFAVLRKFVMRFRGIFRSRASTKLGSMRPFTPGSLPWPVLPRVLRRDIDAVCNAVDLPWSNGQAEGQINRLKTIKRGMYGRAGLELLKARMTPISTKVNKTPFKCQTTSI
ncbi:transposase [Rhizobium sp. 007]|uniref:transposase n=1 Tax=Rhizobium sp. 007 TaxID=2785056 RepID=UPI00188E5F11|nr:transposase [Rhizobium sp. 007]QPB24590.1 transposase [Rhizobium sp. 007]